MPTVHIEANKSDIANIVLMPGDPNRVKYIMDNYLENAKVVNRVRGELGVTGYYKNKKVTILSSGMGNPSMGIYSYELFKFYDVDTIIRIGSAKSLKDFLSLGSVALINSSYTVSNYAENLINKVVKEAESSRMVNEVILNSAKDLDIKIKEVDSMCVDAFYGKVNTTKDVIEMESFALFLNAKVLNKKASAIVTISDNDKEELTSVERERNFDEMIKLALNSIINL